MTHIGRTQSPCRGCADRSPECHASCQKYTEFEAIHADERKEINKKKYMEALSYGAPYRTDKQLMDMHRSFDSTCKILRKQTKGEMK